MINIESYISHLTTLLKEQFGSRLCYVGLQGSYLRREATDESDIDIMIVIDGLGVDDLGTYRAIIRSMDHYDKSCGFICSKEDLASWNPLEICNLLGSTEDHYGTLRDLVPSYTTEDVRNFVKFSVNNMYHELCHRYIHAENNESITSLAATYKGVFFILQNLYYLTHGVFVKTKAEMLEVATGLNRDVLVRSMELKNGAAHDFDESFELLFKWCQETMKAV